MAKNEKKNWIPRPGEQFWAFRREKPNILHPLSPFRCTRVADGCVYHDDDCAVAFKIDEWIFQKTPEFKK